MTCAHPLGSHTTRRSRWVWVTLLLVLGGGGVWSLWARLPVSAVVPCPVLDVGPALHVVTTPVAGQVSVTHLQVGREVQAGEILVVLESTDQRLQVEEAQHQLRALQAHHTARLQERAAIEAAWQAAQQGVPAALDEARARHHDAVLALQATQERQQKLGPLAPLTALQAQQTAVETARVTVQRLEDEQQRHAAEWRVRLAQAQREAVALEGDITLATARLARLESALAARQLRAVMAGRLGTVAQAPPGTFVQAGERLALLGPFEAPTVTVALLPAVLPAPLRSGQAAWLLVSGGPGTPVWSLSATIVQATAAAPEASRRVVLHLAPDALAYWPLQPGVAATLALEIERVAPVILALRAITRSLWGSTWAPTAVGAPGEAP